MNAVVSDVKCPVVLELKKVDFHWVRNGKNNGHPKWKLKFYGQEADVHNAYDTKKWDAIPSYARAQRNIESEADAKLYCEEMLMLSLQAEVDRANRVIKTLAKPFWEQKS